MDFHADMESLPLEHAVEHVRRVATMTTNIAKAKKITGVQPSELGPNTTEVELFVVANMTTKQRERYLEWKKTGKPPIPNFNWDRWQMQLPPGKERVTFTRRVEGMKIAWQHDEVTAEHALYLTKKKPFLLGLIEAIIQVRDAQLESLTATTSRKAQIELESVGYEMDLAALFKYRGSILAETNCRVLAQKKVIDTSKKLINRRIRELKRRQIESRQVKKAFKDGELHNDGQSEGNRDSKHRTLESDQETRIESAPDSDDGHSDSEPDYEVPASNSKDGKAGFESDEEVNLPADSYTHFFTSK